MNYKEEMILSLAGIELDLELLICVILLINNYKVAFWILLIIALLGTIIKIIKIKRLKGLRE